MATKVKASQPPAGQKNPKQMKQGRMDFDRVYEALGEPGPLSTHLAANVRSMLIQGLGFATDTTPADRHEFQNEVINMVENVLSDATSVLAEEHASLKALIQDAPTAGPKEAAEAAVADVAVEVEAATAEAAKKTAELAKAEAVLKTAIEDYEQAEHEFQPAEAIARCADIQKTNAEAIVGVMKELCAVRQSFVLSEDLLAEREKLVIEYMTAGRADKALVAAATGCLIIEPGKRRPFDEVVVEGVWEHITKRSKEAEAKVESSAPMFEEASAFRLGMSAVRDFALEAKEAAAEEASKAINKRAAAVARAAEAEAELQRRSRDHSSAISDLLARDVLVEDRISVISRAVTAFGRLMTQSDTIAVEPVASAEAPAPVPESAAADTAGEAMADMATSPRQS
eukprot:TRINITY_DN20032_c0_g1_i1.p1 TRINITY_DN20032_c0_g1~~TRINITY_DN20032_c0_g1_i1.p1  ORF type:complete len:425 (-),score=115.84 TRINITY_DN20032_c0_g1_i1:63-1259(-)